MTDLYESDSAGSSRGETQSRGMGKWDREAKRKKPTKSINLVEVTQRGTLAHSHGTTSEMSQSGAKRARVLILLHGQSLGDTNFQALPVQDGYRQSWAILQQREGVKAWLEARGVRRS